MSTFPLYEVVEVNQALHPISVAVGAFTGAGVNCSGFDRAMVIVNVGDISTGGGIDCEIKQSDATDGTFAAISGAAMTEITDTTGDNTCVIIDFPIVAATPWIKIYGTVGTAVTLAGGSAILYHGSRLNPPTQGAGETVVV